MPPNPPSPTPSTRSATLVGATFPSSSDRPPHPPHPLTPSDINSNKSTIVEAGGERGGEKEKDLEGALEMIEKAPVEEDRQVGEKEEEGENDPFLVTLKGREHLSPHTWNRGYRWALTAFAGLLVFNATFSSVAPANLIPAIIEEYNVSHEAGILLISLFVAGYSCGPLLWGPLSERYGRRSVFLLASGPYALLQIGCALSPNFAGLVVLRFLSGSFASAPLANSGAVVSDLWDASSRGNPMAIYAIMPFMGPTFAPAVSGFMYVAHVNWPWIFWLLAILAGVFFLLTALLLPETYLPFILVQEARRLRKTTGDNRWHAQLERNDESAKDVLRRTVLKPIIILCQEPMLVVVTAYMSFIFGVVYLLFEAVPIIFQDQHGLNAGEGGLVFLAFLIGSICSLIANIFYFSKDYARRAAARAPRAVPPEVRLFPLLFAAPALAVGFFWLAWTSDASISIVSPIFAIGLMGSAACFAFVSGLNYIVDTYLSAAASALAINTVVRSSFGVIFPLFAAQMYRKLGTPGASSLLGGLAVVFVPAPFLLIKYGKRIRAMSKNAVVAEDE